MKSVCVRAGACALGLLVLAAPAAAAEPLEVFATNYPLAYFAERILAGGGTVRMPPGGGDPADWRPRVDDVLGMQRADVILLNGAGFEPWREWVTLAPSRIVDTSAGFRDRYLDVEDGTRHRHGPTGEDALSAIASTTWIDFTLAVEQAATVRRALVTAGADDTVMAANFDALRIDLIDLDRSLSRATEDHGDAPLIASRPVYGYLARRYGLDVRNLHWEADVAPDEAAWAELEALLAEHPARWMIWERDPLSESVARLAAMGVGSVVFDPAGARPAEADFLTVMRANIARLGAALDGVEP